MQNYVKKSMSPGMFLTQSEIHARDTLASFPAMAQTSKLVNNYITLRRQYLWRSMIR
jgi:hypothetical protein